MTKIVKIIEGVVTLSVSQFYILNGVIVLGLIVYLLRKSPRAGGRLRLQRSSSGARSLPHLPYAESDPQRPLRARTVNVMFNYNGHSWEAYEVLGLPQGSSLQAAEEAFETLAVQSDAQSLPFLVAAFEAIREVVQKENR